jgi:hypothetical protein
VVCTRLFTSESSATDVKSETMAITDPGNPGNIGKIGTSPWRSKPPPGPREEVAFRPTHQGSKSARASKLIGSKVYKGDTSIGVLAMADP